jgi:hypothetical protein
MPYPHTIYDGAFTRATDPAPRDYVWHVLDDVERERERQTELRDAGRFERTLADAGLSEAERLAVVAEEFGEVARCVADVVAGKQADADHLRKELIQLAACCVAWAEFLDSVDPAPDARLARPTMPSAADGDTGPVTETFPPSAHIVLGDA